MIFWKQYFQTKIKLTLFLNSQISLNVVSLPNLKRRNERQRYFWLTL
jgi:hypothetical protein